MVHYGVVKNTGVGKVLKGGLNVARVFARRNVMMPMAIIRTKPGIMARIGAIRGSKCGTVRMNFRSTGRGSLGGPRGKRLTTTGILGGRLGRFEMSTMRRFAIKRRVGTSLFTTKRGVSIAKADGNGKFRNPVGERKRSEKPRSRNSECREEPNSVKTYSFPNEIFGGGGLTKRVNDIGIAIRGLRIIEMSTSGGLVLIGNTVPKPGNSVMAVGRTIGSSGW